MKKLSVIFCLTALLVAAIVGASAWAEPPSGDVSKKTLRVGTFDSRAVAIAFAPSAIHAKYLGDLRQRHEKAKADGDEATVKKIEAEAQAQQDLMHKQGFGTYSVDNILKHIEDQLPEIAQKASVDAIVSKWDLVYQAPSAEFVDVTDLIVVPFEPNERTKKYIRQLKDHAPVPLEKLEHLKCEH